VTAVLADDTDAVRAGQPLLRLDPSDARLALARAQAQLAQTVRQVRTLYAQDSALAATVALREAELQRVQTELARAQEDVQRRLPLAASGAVGAEELTHAQAALDSARGALAAAQAALAAARAQAGANRVLTDGTEVQQHPGVQAAAAAVREAWLALQRMEVAAPLAGVVARRSVQVGQRVAAGSPLMSIVALDRLWVDANFKEVQLREMRIGQPVKLHADLYGQRVEYDGRVAGLGAGTGSAFALLPAQNATGNWIKVVQRLPVRIELDPRQLAEHPLRVGLSMEVTVDVGADGSAPLQAAAPREPATTQVFDLPLAAADRMVQDIIGANLAPGSGRRHGSSAPR
jgi:membrane fusion protein (multidrug efflux system)